MIQQSLAYSQRKLYLEKIYVPPMFTAALFTVAKIWKQPKCLSVDEWIKKMWYKMEYYSVLRKKYCSMCNIDEP